MIVLGGVLVALVALTVLVAVAVSRWLRARPSGVQRAARSLAGRIGPIPAAGSILVCGWVITVAVLVPVGLCCRALVDVVDRPVNGYVAARSGNRHVSTVMHTLTIMGNRDVTELVTLVSLLVLGIAYGRRWWLPTALILAAFFAQRQGQILLTDIVPRTRPDVADAGVFPSGGVSRLVAVDGMVIALALLLLPAGQRVWHARAWTGLAVFAAVEGYTRVYLSVHWLTDVVGGLLFGVLLLTVELAAVNALARRAPAGARMSARAAQA